MGSMKEKAMFVLSVAAAVAVIAYVQKNHYQVPVVGKYLPGGA